MHLHGAIKSRFLNHLSCGINSCFGINSAEPPRRQKTNDRREFSCVKMLLDLLVLFSSQEDENSRRYFNIKIDGSPQRIAVDLYVPIYLQ